MAGNKSFETIFDAYFHQKISFEEFNKIEIEKEIKKINIGSKVVFGCSSKLKKIHSFLSVFVFDRISIREDVVFSYRKNNNVLNAIYPHAKKRAIYKTDIESFFPSIRIDHVKEQLKEHCRESIFFDLEEHLDSIINVISINNRIPIGFPSSPIVSNFAFIRFDNEISSYCQNRQYVYTRYADDILISSDDFLDKGELTKDINEIFKKLQSDYRLNIPKTKVLTKGKPRTIFGVSIFPDGKLSVSRKLKNEIEVKLYLYLKDKKEFLNYSKANTMEGAIVNLSGILNYVNTVDKTYLDKLKAKYGASVIGLFFRKTIENEYRN
ncbi:TPA: RNA-directed DNA polymerase [Klebsiella aerogenes]|nr:RNA-directed DNA polymerase [Klebsiella aerogenes]